MKKIDNIVIIGGGTSAWLAAAYLSHNFKDNQVVFDNMLIASITANSCGEQSQSSHGGYRVDQFVASSTSDE